MRIHPEERNDEGSGEMLSGTEADIINSVAILRMATKDQIRRQVGFSLEYIGFLCRILIRRGYLNFSQGYYSLAKEGIKTLLAEEEPKVDRRLLKEIAGEVAKEITGELKKAVRGIKIPLKEVKVTGWEREETGAEAIKIKTDFDFPVADESLALESNIGKIGTKLEKEKSDIDKSVELLKKFRKEGNRDDKEERRKRD